MRILFSSLCKIGGRACNQDYVGHCIKKDKACLVVCDGLGSYKSSDIISKLCTETLVTEYKKGLENGENVFHYETVKRWFEKAYDNVLAAKSKNDDLGGACTTVACVTTDGNSTVISHIGDTRVYFFRNNKLIFRSIDHSLAQIAVDSGKILPQDIRKHKDQNKLTRVLGSDYYIIPDFHKIDTPLQKGDTFLLCSDGFWEYVYEKDMEKILSASGSPKEALVQMEERLVKRADNDNDNYSALLAVISE